MSLTKTSYAMIDSTTVNVLDFVTATEKALIEAGTPSIDVSSYIQAAHNSLPQLDSNYQGTLYFPAGKYRVDSGLTLYSTVNVQGYGAILDFSNLSVTGTAISTYSYSTGYEFDTVAGTIAGLTLVGPSHTATASNGIFFGDPSPTGTLVCHEHSYRDLVIQQFGHGVNQGNNSYNIRFYNCLIYRCNINAYFSSRTNSSENVEFHSTVLSEGYMSALRSEYNSLDISYFGGSVDYPQSGADGISIDGDAIITFYGTHFEGAKNAILIRNPTHLGNPTVNCYGCTFTIQEGSDVAYPVISADYIHLNVFGGWFRCATGTQSIFISSAGSYNLFLQNLIFYSSPPTYKVYYGSSVSGNKTVDNQMFTPATIVGDYKALLTFGLGTNFGLYFRTASGAPSSGQLGIEQGSILLNQSDKKLYINTGTSASTIWTVVGTQT